MKKRPSAFRWTLLAVLILLPLACTKTYQVAPQAPDPVLHTHTVTHVPTNTSTWTPETTDTPTEVPTNPPTVTLTETPTDTLTDVPTDTPTDSTTATLTDTPTDVPTDTPTETPTDVLGDTPTFTETSSPSATPSETETPTETVSPPPIYCTTTPVAPSYYNEVEPIGVGGPTNGTNENCSPGEDIGAITTGTSRVVTGSLSHSGNTGSNYDAVNDDLDVFAFTADTTGTWQFSLDCFTNGLDTNDFDLILFGPTCPTYPDFFNQPALFGSAYYGPTEIFNYDLTAGETYYAMVIGWEGQPQATYRMVITSP